MMQAVMLSLLPNHKSKNQGTKPGKTETNTNGNTAAEASVQDLSRNQREIVRLLEASSNEIDHRLK